MTHIRITALLAITFLYNFSIASPCNSYLQKNEMGIPVGTQRVESHWGSNVQVIDVSGRVVEATSTSAADLQIFKIDEVFAEPMPFLGFGRPNVYMALPRALSSGGSRVEKFDAKSLKRADSRIIPTRNKAQSGLIIVFKNLSPEKIQNLYKQAQSEVGTRSWTCVNANCKILTKAGFTSDGKPLDNYYFPSFLFHRVISHGLEVDGVPIEFDVIRTSPNYLEAFGAKVTKSVVVSPCRHADRACANGSKKNNLVSYLYRLKGKLAGTVAMVIHRRSSDADQSPELVIDLPEALTTSEDHSLDLEVSEPSKLGALFRMLWGPHALFEMKSKNVVINNYLPKVLKAFPQEDPDFVTKLKQNLLFSKVVVGFIRSNLSKSYSSHPERSQKFVYDMMRVHADGQPNKYNVVVTGEKAIVLKLDIKNSLIDWVLSKHVLLADYSGDVRFAGEMWKNDRGQLVISGNSGTFRPSTEQVRAAVKMMSKVLPDVDVIAAEEQL